MNKKIAFIFGTRPEIIKMSSIIQQCVKRKVPFFCIHTGQHYSYEMSQLFLKELSLPEPDYKLGIKSKAPYRQGDHTGRMMVKIEEILLKEMPNTVLVQGDTNSALAGALTTSKIATTRSFTGFDMKVGHVEAGLRSYDRSMPEEINRVIADHISDYLFAPTHDAAKIALSEGVKKAKVHVTGNTVVDALFFCVERIRKEKCLFSSMVSKNAPYMLLTLHRQENVDDPVKLKNILKGLEKVYKKFGIQILFPIHPRTVKKLEAFNFRLPGYIRTIDPCGFLEFVDLERNAELILSDSGGVQEEACALKVPCVTLRDSTERPESVAVGANIVAGHSPDSIFSAACKMMSKDGDWHNPFGDGKAGEKIIDTLLKK